MWRSNVRGKRPACTEKRKARFVQRDRPEAGVEPARENYGYFFPEIGLSVRLKILSIWIAVRDEPVSTELRRKIRRTAGRAPSEAAECGPAASKMRPKRGG